MKAFRLNTFGAKAFTVVELVIVIVVIAILASITVIAYNATQDNIRRDALVFELTGAATALEEYRNHTSDGEDYYPDNFIDAGFVPSDGVTETYQKVDARNYCLEFTDGKFTYFVQNGSDTEEGSCPVDETLLAVFIYDTRLSGCATTVQLPIYSPSSNSASVINWGDGSTEALTSRNQSHTYASEGEYRVTYSGAVSQVSTSNIPSANRGCLKSVEKWGQGMTPSSVEFGYSTQLTNVAEPPSSVTNMRYMFRGATAFNQNINNWNVSNVTNMEYMFNGASAFNQPLNSWNVSKVTTMRSMFMSATAFNQPLGSWNVSSVTNVSWMFYSAPAFNQSLANWNTTNVTTMALMFMRASAFNGSVSNWNLSKVTTTESMFEDAIAFNQAVSSWSTSTVTRMARMFYNAEAFNQSLSAWNVSSVTTMESMFARTEVFNQPLSTWNTASVTDMTNMFYYAVGYNQNLSSWNVNAVTSRGGFDYQTPQWTQAKPNWVS